jgi:hypothetical protein
MIGTADKYGKANCFNVYKSNIREELLSQVHGC